MKIFKEGEKSKALCGRCKKTVGTTFAVRDVSFSNGRGLALGVLAGVCDECGEVVAVPQQSAPRIREQRKRLEKSLEARVPKHLQDLLLLSYANLGISGRIDGRSDVAPVVKYYVFSASVNFKESDFRRFTRSALFSGKSSQRISIKLPGDVFDEFCRLCEKLRLSKTDLVKSFLLRFYEESLDRGKAKKLREIFSVAA